MLEKFSTGLWKKLPEIPLVHLYYCSSRAQGAGKPADLVASGQGVTGARKGSGQAVQAKAGQLGAGGQVADQ